MLRTELACHTGYSRMNGLGSVQNWTAFACDKKIKTLVITDRGNVDSWPEFVREIGCRKGNDTKLIIGADLLVYDDRQVKGNDDIVIGQTIDEYATSDNVSCGRLTVLIQNETGRSNIYKILNEGERKYRFENEIRIPLSLLLSHREGLLIGSGSEDGLFHAEICERKIGEKYQKKVDDTIASGKSVDSMERSEVSEENDLHIIALRADFLDYVEILSKENPENTRKLIEFSEYCHCPAVVVSAPHYMQDTVAEKLAWGCLKDAWTLTETGQNLRTAHYESTDELLRRFSWLGEEKALELVVGNSCEIADRCETVLPFSDEKQYPYIQNQDEILREICEKALKEKYPEAADYIKTPGEREIEGSLDRPVRIKPKNSDEKYILEEMDLDIGTFGERIWKRLDWELAAIRETKSAFIFLQIRDLVCKMVLQPYEIEARGSFGVSFVAFLLGLTELDPIKYHLPPYGLYGFLGNKLPAVDINFGINTRRKLREILETAPGIGKIVMAGCHVSIEEKEAATLLKNYIHKLNYPRCNDGCNDKADFIDLSMDRILKEDRDNAKELLSTCVKKRNYCYPEGMLLLPEILDTGEILPVTEASIDGKSVPICVFDFYCIDGRFYRFDACADIAIDLLKELEQMTGLDPETIQTDDPEVIRMFNPKTAPDRKNIPIFSKYSSYLDMFSAIKPRNFEELVKTLGLVWGSDLWDDNVENLINLVDIGNIPTFREDLFNDYFYSAGSGRDNKKKAFIYTEKVRKGKIRYIRNKIGGETAGERVMADWIEWKSYLKDHEVPDCIAQYLEKVFYMFPKAVAYSCMLNAWRIAWYQLHYPEEYEKAKTIWKI